MWSFLSLHRTHCFALLFAEHSPFAGTHRNAIIFKSLRRPLAPPHSLQSISLSYFKMRIKQTSSFPQNTSALQLQFFAESFEAPDSKSTSSFALQITKEANFQLMIYYTESLPLDELMSPYSLSCHPSAKIFCLL